MNVGSFVSRQVRGCGMSGRMRQALTLMSNLFYAKFVKNVAVLVLGTGLGQCLTILTAPLLSRLYDPSAFGVLSLYTSIVSILAVMMAGRYELAIVLPEKDDDAVNILMLALLITFGLTAASILILPSMGRHFSQYVPGARGVPWLWMIPISVFAMGVYQSLAYWCTRKQAFARLSIFQIFRSVGVAGTQTTGGILHAGAPGLVFGQVAGQILATSILFGQVLREDKRIIRDALCFAKIQKLAKDYVRFPLYSTPQTLLNEFSQNVPAFILTYAFGTGVVGYYSLALRLIQLPYNLIGQSITQVFYQKVSKDYHDRKNIYQTVKRSTLTLAAVAMLPTIALVGFGPQLFTFVLGEAWFQSGLYAQWMAVWVFFGFLNTPSFVTAQVYGLQRFLLCYEIGLFISRTAVLYWGALSADALSAIALFSVTGGVFNCFLIVAVMFYVKKQMRHDAERSSLPGDITDEGAT